jgi:hypothetical protein
MSKISDAADAVKRFAAQHQAILDIGNILGEIASVEQARDEADVACSKARGELAAAQAQLLSAQKAYSELLEASTKLAEDTRLESERVIEKARYDAEAIVAAAKIDADNLRDIAKKDAAATRAAAAKEAQVTSELVAAKRQEMIDINVKVDAANRSLAQTQDAIAELKSKAKDILG